MECVVQSWFQRRQPTTGLVIRSSEVELLIMRRRRAISRVRVAIGGGEPTQLVQAIRRAFAEAGVPSSSPCAVAIPTQDVLFRCFSIPRIPRSERDAAVKFEARKYIPFKLDELIWDARLSQPAGQSRLDVVFAALQRNTFQRLREALNEAGVEPLFVEPTSLSLARLVGQGRASEETFQVLVDLEGDVAHLAIVRGGLAYLARDISLSGGDEERAPRLLSELSVLINFFTREHPSSSITHVFLFGEEAIVGPWCRALSEGLRCPVELGNRWVESTVGGGLPLSFAAAVGLLQPRPDRTSIDFLQRSLAASATADRAPAPTPIARSMLLQQVRSREAAATALVGLLLGAFIWFSGARQIAQERQRLASLVQVRPTSIRKLAAMTSEQLEGLKQRLTAQLATLEQMVKPTLRVALVLDALARALPDGVWLTGLAFEQPLNATGMGQPQLTVSGACFLQNPAEELRVIQQFEETLKRDPRLSATFTMTRVDKVDERVAIREQQTYRTFELMCSAERTRGGS